jgi:nitroimidazol reductase NimA-like FMN-containing flavoprotein (pyridoxamine 5'-phosphate oxidase superfamily)
MTRSPRPPAAHPPATDPPATDPRATIRVHRDRDAGEEAASFLADGLVAHVAFVDDGQPVVIPMTYHARASEPHRLYLHGGHHSRLLRHLASGAPVCVAVTLVDGVVYSRTAMNHSVNYRSVVCFGRAAAVQPGLEEQRAVMHEMIGRYTPGRVPGIDFEPIPDVHVRATAFVALEVEARSAKARRGGPKGPHDQDATAPGTAGVVTFARPA